MGLDFNEVEQKKHAFKGFDTNILINNDDFDEEMIYFCCFMDYFYQKYEKVSFAAYYKFCVALDAYLYSLMYLDEECSMQSLIGFLPGKLFCHTVDNGNHDLFYALNVFYRDEWVNV